MFGINSFEQYIIIYYIYISMFCQRYGNWYATMQKVHMYVIYQVFLQIWVFFLGPVIPTNISKISSAFSGVMVFFPTSSKVSAVVPCCCRYASVVFSNDLPGRGAGRGCRWHWGAGRGASRARGALWLRLAAESSTLKVRSEGLLVWPWFLDFLQKWYMNYEIHLYIYIDYLVPFLNYLLVVLRILAFQPT